LFSQSRDRSGWNDFGSSHVNKWLQITPAKLGPNALPVPEMDYAQIGKSSNWKAEFMTGLNDYHYNTFKLNLVYDFGLLTKK
jgi:hypothetical protein